MRRGPLSAALESGSARPASAGVHPRGTFYGLRLPRCPQGRITLERLLRELEKDESLQLNAVGSLDLPLYLPLDLPLDYSPSPSPNPSPEPQPLTREPKP